MSEPDIHTPAELSAEALELLQYLLEEELEVEPARAPIRRAGRAVAPLSYAQQRLWFIDQLQPGLPVYNLAWAVRVRGELNVGALERTLGEVVRRHESLRTVFGMEDGRPVQVIRPARPVALPVVDLQGLSEGEREDEAHRLAAAEARRPFDLAAGPLLRATLLRLSPESHIAVLVMHHAVSDGWSMGVLFKEVGLLYEAFAAGRPSPLPELPIQYADYAAWQREWLESEATGKKLEYWRRQLAGAPERLELPARRARPPVQGYRGAVETRALPSSLAERLKALSLRNDATLFMTLLAAFQTLLWRYTGQTDLVVGTPVAGRDRLETEGLIGFFVNTLPLRADLSGDPSFLELLGRVRNVALEAYENRDVPFEKVVEQVRPERSLSHQPLFQVALVLLNEPKKSLRLPGVTLSPLELRGTTTRFDVTLVMGEADGTLAAAMEYSTDLWDGETAGRVLGHFETLLAGVAATPGARLSTLPLLTPPERHQILTRWNGPADGPAPDKCLHELFEEQAARTPDAVALTCEGSGVTYGELNRRADRVARRLRASGAAPERLVGIYAERSIEMVVGILATLKAGAAYVPLDPAYPAQRLAFVMEDAGIETVLTQRRLSERLGEFAVRVVCLDEGEEADDSGREPQPCPAVLPSNASYVIYTSGSTGTPKGVVVTHANVARLFSATEGQYGFNGEDVWTLFHSYAFDFSVWELWGALLYGGRLVVVPFVVSRNPEAFYELLAEERVTVLNQTPLAFQQLSEAEERAGGAPEALALRLVIFGGEALDVQSLGRWFERHGDERPRLVNMYGITETTVHVTSRRLLAADARENGGSPIGRRLGDLQVYVLDAWMQPVPVGVAGEVYVGGAGLARGYLRRPALTAERFVPHPFGGAGGERLYRSGDVARLAADGSLEYLGRCDGQVKVRGFRIEPGEIEAALRQHEAVKEALVVAAEGGRRLVAYVTAAEDARARALADELRAHLKGRLPDYMVPAAFVLLERLPLSANGKIDRRALPEPDEAAPSPGAGHVAPGDAVEEALAAIWGAVLNVERVGIHDNFFDLGGDSIRSVRVLAMAKERGLEFSLQQLFQHQTVGELAREIRAAAGADPLPAAKPEPFGLVSDGDRSQVPAGVEDAYPLAMLQAGMLYHMAYTPGQIVYHNVYSYHLRGRFDPELFQETLRGVVERHAILRTSFDLTAYSEPLQLVHRAVDFPVRVDDLRGLGHEKQETILAEFVEAEKGRPFDLSRPPLLRFHIHRRTDETFNFTFTECHPILDGWSLHSLLAEIFSTYFARLKGGQAAPRPPLASSYRDFVALERAALNSEACQHYWGRKLDDCPASELPRWPGALPGGDGPRIERLHFPLSEEMSARLRRLARSLGVPLKSVLLAAHLKALGVMSGRADVLTGLVSGGRPEEADGENVLGLFFNTLPFRGDVSGGTWADLIRRTFKEELESLPFRRYPVAALQQRRGRRPIFESVFNYLHFHVLDDLLKSDDLGFLGVSSYWEETNLTFSVAFMLPPLSSQILLTLRYDATSFPAAQMQAAGGIYERILAAMVGDPSAPHGPQCFLPEAELERLLVRWNDTGAGRRPARCVHQSFEQQAAERPDAFAVACEGERLTYGELNRRANRLARYLQARGVGPEARVGICLERSARTLVAILGVMKAGGAYVALDAAYPAERNASILEQARVHILLTESRLAGGLPACGAPAVCIDSDPGLIGEAGEGNVSSGVAPGNAAYLLFTSGSTGRPKGVVVEHAQLTNYAEGILERLRPPAGASFAMLSTFATDLGNTVLFPALLTGGCLHVLSQEQAADPLTVADYFTRHPIDCLKIVPSHLAALLASPSAERVLPRRRLIMGGEAASSHLLERLRELAPGCAVFNHYGPTETTVGVLTHEVEQAPPGRVPEALPLGRPLPNVQIYLLDQSLVPVPVGTAGELYVGGANVARGYFGRPALTAEKFLPHPFGRVPGARLYRTGDVARYLPDGKVEFLGRLDSQVKIRGYRVELGEVENVLSQHPGVREAVVTAREGAPGTRRLVAYVVLDADAPPAAGEMRNFLRAKLPDFMIPSSFVRLESLPLTPGGKVNRGALPTPPDPGADAGTVHVSPRNEVERAIASVWGEALRAEHFGVHDNFFDLGGHSLILLQVQSKLRQVFGREISIVEMFEHPTVRALADHLGRRQDEPTVSPHVYEEAEARRALLRRRQTTLQPET